MSVLDGVAPVVLATYEQDLAELGLSGLAGWAASFQGDDATFQLELEKQPLYRERFAPVFDRRERIARGERVAPLSVAQQLDYERQARNIESFYGLPSETIDVRETLRGDVAIEELWFRAALAQDDAEQAYRTPEGRAVIDQLLGTDGINPGHIVAFYLDPDRTRPELLRATQSAQVAAAASRSRFSLTVEEATALRDAGIDPDLVSQRASTLTTAGDVRFGVGGDLDALSRQQEVGFLADDPTQMQDLARRSQRLTARFGGGGSFTRSQDGSVLGLGRA